jgi:8-oxo-dGTP pyrophosphatase MutT (NUDIX family)
MRFNILRVAFQLREVWSWFARPIHLGVRIILLQDGNVLLVRHTYMEGWYFPGGSMNRWETPLEAAAREAWEEAGAELLEPPDFLGIITTYSSSRSDHVATYLSRNFRLGRASDQWEIAETKFFAMDDLPPQLGDRWRKVVQDLVEKPEQG